MNEIQKLRLLANIGKNLHDKLSLSLSLYIYIYIYIYYAFKYE